MKNLCSPGLLIGIVGGHAASGGGGPAMAFPANTMRHVLNMEGMSPK